MLKNDAKYIVAYLLMAVATHEFAPDWCGWVMDSIIGSWLHWLYVFMADYYSVKFAIALFFAIVGLSYAWRIATDRDFRWYRPALLIWFCILMYDRNTLHSVTLWNDFDFSKLALIICAIVVIGMLAKAINWFWPYQDVIHQWWKKHREKTKKDDDFLDCKSKGFNNDDIKPQLTPKTLQLYADVIIGQLLDTNIDNHSFAVGITGEWGSGKTTFLDLLESNLLGKAEIISFNPWMCRTPGQVTDDFFANLQQQLSRRHSSLSRPIRDYAKYISNATISLGHGLFSKITLSFQQDSLQEKKKRLSDRFAKLKKPVVVKIDDLDRLESSEVFEVLRLIRNTADLKNTIYLVAYDKEYVTNVLKSKDIKDASAYLEKIFPVEIHQPKVEDYQIKQVLLDDLNGQKTISGNLGDELYKRLRSQEKELVFKILGNYRQTKRFVRVYSLNVMYIQKVFTNEINLLELFWMELLQTYDKTVYDILAKDPDKLLYINNGRYILRPGIIENEYISKEEEKHKYFGDIIWKEEASKILETLFGRLKKVTSSSVCKTENYVKYFTLGVSSYKLSKKEFRDFFKNKGSEENTIRGWFNDGKYIDSVKYQFENCIISTLNDEDFKSYITGILSYGLILGEYNIDRGRTVRELLKVEKYNTNQTTLGNKIIKEWFEEKIRCNSNLLAITLLLNRMYISNEYDENLKQIYISPIIVSNDDIAQLIKKSMMEYLKQNSELTALDILNEKSEFGTMFKNCCVQTDEVIMSSDMDKWENVAFEVIIDYFKDKPKISLSAEKDAIDKMFMDNMPEYSDDPETQECYEYALENRQYKINAYFGTSDKPFEKFLKECFSDAKDGNTDVAPKSENEREKVRNSTNNNKKRSKSNTKSKKKKRK